IAHPDSKPPTRDSRLGYLKHRGADLPALADERVIHVNTFGGEIFAQFAVREWSADLVLPPPCVFDGVCVDHLVGSTVCLAIRLVVAREVHTSDSYPAVDRRFPDSALSWTTVVLKLAHGANVNGENSPCGSFHRLSSFQYHRSDQGFTSRMTSSST